MNRKKLLKLLIEFLIDKKWWKDFMIYIEDRGFTESQVDDALNN